MHRFEPRVGFFAIVMCVGSGAGAALAGAGAPADDITRAQYDSVRMGMTYAQVVAAFGREGVQEVDLYAWKAANLQVGFSKKDGRVTEFGILQAGKKPLPLYEKFRAAFQEQVVKGGKPMLRKDVEKVLGTAGKAMTLTKLSWKNLKGGKITVEIEANEVKGISVMGRLK